MKRKKRYRIKKNRLYIFLILFILLVLLLIRLLVVAVSSIFKGGNSSKETGEGGQLPMSFISGPVFFKGDSLYKAFKLKLEGIEMQASMIERVNSENIFEGSQFLTSLMSPNKLMNSSELSKISAQAIKVVDLSKKEVILDRDMDKKLEAGSFAHLFLADYSLAFFKDEDIIKANYEAIGMVHDNGPIAFLEEEEYSLKNIFSAMLGNGGDDAAYVLADAMGRKINPKVKDSSESVKAYIESVNKRFASLAMKKTVLTDAAGNDSKSLTSANDLEIVTNKLLKNKSIREVISSYRMAEYLPSGRGVTWYNTNEFLASGASNYRSGVKGVKVSSVGGKYSIISLYERNGKEYLVILLNSKSLADSYGESKLIFDKIDKIK